MSQYIRIYEFLYFYSTKEVVVTGIKLYFSSNTLWNMKFTNTQLLALTIFLTLNLAVGQDSERNSEMINTSFYLDKFQRNITIFASGQDNPWSLEIGSNNSMKLLIAPDTEIIASLYKKEKNQNNQTTTYFATFKDGHIQFEMSEEACQEYPYSNNFQSSATLHFHDTNQSNYQLLRGCAEWVPNYRLHEIWMLHEINNQLFDKENLYKNIPRIEFHLNNFKVYGFSGCNEFEGEFELNHDILRIKKIHITTQEKCELDDFERQFITGLQHQSYSFKIRQGVLKMNNNKNSFVFRRTD